MLVDMEANFVEKSAAGVRTMCLTGAYVVLRLEIFFKQVHS